MPEEKETKKTFKKSEIEWKPDKSQILTIEETLQKMKKEEKKE